MCPLFLHDQDSHWLIGADILGLDWDQLYSVYYCTINTQHIV